MSDIQVTNNTMHTLHMAFAWGGVVQYFENNVKPGETKSFNKFGIGFSDFTVVVGNDDNKFSHDNDFLGILGIAGIAGGAVMAVAGLALLPVTGGASSAILAAGVSAATVTAASVGVAVTGAAIAIGGVVLEVADATLAPATIKGFDVGKKQRVSVTGGEIIGDIKTDENGEPIIDENGNVTLVATEIKPLQTVVT